MVNVNDAKVQFGNFDPITVERKGNTTFKGIVPRK